MINDTAVKERPILMSAPMVCALIEDRKTQTRRVIKDPPPAGFLPWGDSKDNGALCRIFTQDGNSWPDARVSWTCRSPYGVPGDRLWVRETWGKIHGTDAGVIYRADGPHDGIKEWKPSIHMPRWASRITLEITGVRVERVQAITEKDAEAEGAEIAHLEHLGQTWSTHRMGYELLWNRLNAKRGYGWDKNPWVWVIEFRRVTI
jgi:hypothetical protein